MSADRSNIEAAKARLPLPELLRKLGLEAPASGEGNMRSPFAVNRRQKTPSFSIFQRADAWGWCDRTGGQEIKGDEITLLEKLESLSRSDAIARYLSLAGVESARPAPPARSGKASANTARAADSSDALDWSAAVAKLTSEQIAQLAKWRGISPAFIEWLRAQSLIGLCKESTAFPVHDAAGRTIAAHIRPKNGRWFYWPKNAGIRPLIIGDLTSAQRTLVFESQWDAFAIMDAMAWHERAPENCAVLITRGASNGRLAARAAGRVYPWPQNDPEKDGKRAGEEWLREVAAHAPGEIFRVAVPAKYKDANDWTRAESVDAIESAARMEKPSALKEAVRPQNGSEPPARPPLDPVAVLDELGLYWLNGSPVYFLRRVDGTRTRFLEMGAAEVRRKLRVRYKFRHKADADAGETDSQIDRIFEQATESHALDYAANIGGLPAGVYDLPGGRVLVRKSPRLIVPVAGDFSPIEDFLTALLGEDSVRFVCWLKVAYEALRAGIRRPGQALIIIGPPDCGKSRIQHQIITPILAGRHADPKSFFFGRTDFNAELVGAEHLLIEEVPSSSKHEERLFFGERIKEIVANDTARLHKKNRDAATVSPFWRLSITLNDNPEKLRCLPPLTDDLAEKIIMLQAKPAPEFWARYADAPDPRKAFRDDIEAASPAFCHYLQQLTIPDAMQGRRYGVASYIPEEIGLLIFEGEPEHHLLLLIDKSLFDDDDERTAWRGDAEDLKQALCAESSPVRASAVRLLGGVQLATIGIWLSHLAAKFPARIQKHRRGDKREWIINPPSA